MRFSQGTLKVPLRSVNWRSPEVPQSPFLVLREPLARSAAFWRSGFIQGSVDSGGCASGGCWGWVGAGSIKPPVETGVTASCLPGNQTVSGICQRQYPRPVVSPRVRCWGLYFSTVVCSRLDKTIKDNKNSYHSQADEIHSQSPHDDGSSRICPATRTKPK